MKLKILTLIIFASLFFGIANTAHAEDFSDQSSREGIVVSGFGFGGYETLETERATLHGGLRVGGGFTEDIMLYLEAAGSWLHQPTLANLILFDGQVKGQYYFLDNIYINLGAGMSVGKTQTPTMAASKTKSGFITSAGAGYEFRMRKNFFLAPEVRMDYRRLAGTNYLSVELGGQIGVHF